MMTRWLCFLVASLLVVAKVQGKEAVKLRGAVDEIDSNVRTSIDKIQFVLSIYRTMMMCTNVCFSFLSSNTML